MIECVALDTDEFAKRPTFSIERLKWTRVGSKWKVIIAPTADDPRDPSSTRGGSVYFDGESCFTVPQMDGGQLRRCVISSRPGRPYGFLDDAYPAFDLLTPVAIPGARATLEDSLKRPDSFCMVEEGDAGEVRIEHGLTHHPSYRWRHFIRTSPVPHVAAWRHHAHIPGRPVNPNDPFNRIEFEIEEWAEFDGVVLPARGPRRVQSVSPDLVTLSEQPELQAKLRCGLMTVDRVSYAALSPSEAAAESFRPDFDEIFRVRDERFAESVTYVVGRYELVDGYGETHYLREPITPDNAGRLLGAIIEQRDSEREASADEGDRSAHE